MRRVATVTGSSVPRFPHLLKGQVLKSRASQGGWENQPASVLEPVCAHGKCE